MILLLCGLAFAFRPGPKPGLPNIIWDSRPDSITGIFAHVEEIGDSMHIEQRIYFQSATPGTLSIFAPHASGLMVKFDGFDVDSVAKDRYALSPGIGSIVIKGMVSTEYAVSRGMTSWDMTNQFSLGCPIRWLEGDRIKESDIGGIFIFLDLEDFRTMQTSTATEIGGRSYHVYTAPDILFSGERLEKKQSQDQQKGKE